MPLLGEHVHRELGLARMHARRVGIENKSRVGLRHEAPQYMREKADALH